LTQCKFHPEEPQIFGAIVKKSIRHNAIVLGILCTPAVIWILIKAAGSMSRNVKIIT
jgi:hypothetical protein